MATAQGDKHPLQRTRLRACFCTAVLGWCLGAASAAPLTQTRAAGNCADANNGLLNWGNPQNATNSDDQWATVYISNWFFSPLTSNDLRCTNFGFSIPNGAQINGIVLNVERSIANDVDLGLYENFTYDNRISLIKNNNLGGTNQASSSLYPTYDSIASYGSAYDNWGDGWAPSDINSGDFGAAISVKRNNAILGQTARIDQLSITVYYTPATPPPPPPPPPTEPTLGGFNVIDSSLSSSSATTGRIYTKLAGTAFNLKVAALNAAKTATETAYAISGNKTVTLDLFDDSTGSSCNASASACSSCSKPKIATSQTLSFSSADAGFKTSANITLPNAYQRILARASNGSTTACSTDVFSVRPSAFTSLGSSASNTALTGAPVFKAGTDSFSLSVGTAVAGYRGTPKINPAAMAANAATWVLGSLSSTAFPAATTSGSNSTASGNFYYSEAGHFKFLGTASTGGNSAGIYDDTWTAVDQNGDCIANSLSNTLSAGKYGCGFGLNTDSPLLGRFVPDHFKLTASSLSAANTSFVYMGQSGLGLAYSVEARSGNNVGNNMGNSTPNSVTQNYSQGRVPVVNPSLVAEDQPSSNQSCNLGTRISGLPSTSWSNGKYTLPSTNTTFSRPANTSTALNASSAANCTATKDAAAGPFDALDVGLQIAAPDTTLLGSDLNMRADTSGACTPPTGTASTTACNAQKLGRTSVRFGRIQLSNANGTPRLALDIPVQAEYWMGTAFVANTLDNSTPVSPPNKTTLPANTAPNGAVGLYFYPGNPLGSSLTTATVSTTVAGTNYSNVLKNGRTAVRLSAPSSSTGTFTGVGFADVVLGVPSYLTGNWLNCLGQTGAAGVWDDYPCARAMFGVYANTPKLAYRRENY